MSVHNNLGKHLHVSEFMIIFHVGVGRIWVVFPYILWGWRFSHT